MCLHQSHEVTGANRTCSADASTWTRQRASRPAKRSYGARQGRTATESSLQRYPPADDIQHRHLSGAGRDQSEYSIPPRRTCYGASDADHPPLRASDHCPADGRGRSSTYIQGGSHARRSSSRRSKFCPRYGALHNQHKREIPHRAGQALSGQLNADLCRYTGDIRYLVARLRRGDQRILVHRTNAGDLHAMGLPGHSSKLK